MLLSNSTNFHILIFSGVLLFLFVLRWLAVFTSPDKGLEQQDNNTQTTM